MGFLSYWLSNSIPIKSRFQGEGCSLGKPECPLSERWLPVLMPQVCVCVWVCMHLHKHEMRLLVQPIPTPQVWAVAGPDTASEHCAWLWEPPFKQRQPTGPNVPAGASLTAAASITGRSLAPVGTSWHQLPGPSPRPGREWEKGFWVEIGGEVDPETLV